MHAFEDVRWEDNRQRVVLSPQAGGRVVSWSIDGAERVLAPYGTEGGLLRVLFAEEQYPGSNYTTPHRLLAVESDGSGFTAHLRYEWNTCNRIMRAAGWSEKANELHIDRLRLDKRVTFRADDQCILCELAITNLSRERKYVTPWLHNCLIDFAQQRSVHVAGQREPDADTDSDWSAHAALMDAAMPIVPEGRGLCCVLGAEATHLAGMAAMLPVPGEFHESTCELRGRTLTLDPGQRWRRNCFLALTDDAERWLNTTPEPLHSAIKPAGDGGDDRDGFAMLERWMLDNERRSGLMVLSFLDKPPFVSPSRYAAGHTFAGFHLIDGGAEAHVMLYASRDLGPVHAEVAGPAGWCVRFGGGPAANRAVCALKTDDFVPLVLRGPSDLYGATEVRVTLTVADQAHCALQVAADVGVERRYAYQVRQAPVYLEARDRERRGPAADADARQIAAWQTHMRDRLLLRMRCMAAVERQEGETCIREKWLIQSEPGIWVPGFLIRPKSLRGRRPVLYQLHGSGPGKDSFAGDESTTPVQTQHGHELELMAYRVATRLNCLLYMPDGRGQGEMGETNPSQYPSRLDALGLSNTVLRVLDQMRALDWLVSREDVDPSRVGSFGCSGGGGLTYLFAAYDPRVAASIVSSTSAMIPLPAFPEGYFHQEFASASVPAAQRAGEPITQDALGMLVAPRPMWIMDGRDDLDIPAADRPDWRARKQRGRDAIRAIYRGLGAEDHFDYTCFPAGHCGGMTVANVSAWFRRWFGE